MSRYSPTVTEVSAHSHEEASKRRLTSTEGASQKLSASQIPFSSALVAFVDLAVRLRAYSMSRLYGTPVCNTLRVILEFRPALNMGSYLTQILLSPFREGGGLVNCSFSSASRWPSVVKILLLDP